MSHEVQCPVHGLVMVGPDKDVAVMVRMAHADCEPPVTADHTPERLSAEDKRLLGCTCWSVVPGKSQHARSCPGDAVEAILAAHLADVEARLLAALHPDPSKPAGGKP